MANANYTSSQRCSRCGETKPLDGFHRSKNRPNGRHPQCKICRSWIGREAALAKNDKRRERVELMSAGKQRCTSCEGVYPLDEFYPNQKSLTGRKSQCIPCYSAVGKAYRETPEAKERARRKKEARFKKDPEGHREAARWAAVKSKYGITREDYDLLLASQGGACAICRDRPKANKRLYVDHDHDTGVVRGLLCHPCNTGLGMFKDDSSILVAAAGYLP